VSAGTRLDKLKRTATEGFAEPWRLLDLLSNQHDRVLADQRHSDSEAETH
jgi:hypothetical protein